LTPAHTLDGKTPAPVDMVNFPLFAGFETKPGGAGRISEPSTVCYEHVQGLNGLIIENNTNL